MFTEVKQASNVSSRNESFNHEDNTVEYVRLVHVLEAGNYPYVTTSVDSKGYSIG